MARMHNALGHNRKGWSFWKYHLKLLCCSRIRQTHKLWGLKTSQPRRMTRVNLWSQALKPSWFLFIFYLREGIPALYLHKATFSHLIGALRSLFNLSNILPLHGHTTAMLVVKSDREFVSNLALFLSVGVSKSLRRVEEQLRDVASIKTPTLITYVLLTGPKKQHSVIKFFTLGT